jgi:hypothetical protein
MSEFVPMFHRGFFSGGAGVHFGFSMEYQNYTISYPICFVIHW